MGSEALRAMKIYRHLVRLVRKHIGVLSDPSSVQNKLKLAHDYAYLLNNVHHQKELLFSYNIAVDRSDEMKRILGKSASSFLKCTSLDYHGFNVS